MVPLAACFRAAASGHDAIGRERQTVHNANMNNIRLLKNATAYESDYARWCAEQGALLRAGKLEALDRENLAEEIETLGRSEKSEIENRLNVLLLQSRPETVWSAKDAVPVAQPTANPLAHVMNIFGGRK